MLVQFVVLAATAVLFLFARRDLASRREPPAQPQTADTQELEQLCATLEALVTDLARRLGFVERRLAQEQPGQDKAPLPSFAEVGALLAAPSATISVMPTAVSMPAAAHQGEGAAGLREGEAKTAPAQPVLDPSFPMPTVRAEVPDPRYVPAYALLEEGITDPIEIARRTGLGRGEVDLIISLRARRAL